MNESKKSHIFSHFLSENAPKQGVDPTIFNANMLNLARRLNGKTCTILVTSIISFIKVSSSIDVNT